MKARAIQRAVKGLALATSLILGVAAIHSCDSGPGLPTEPALEMLVSVSVNPSSGPPPLVVDFTVSVSNAPAGTITYRFDCAGDGTFEIQVDSRENPYTAEDLCTYADPGTFVPRVQVAGDRPAEGRALISVSAVAGSSTDSAIVEMRDNVFVVQDLTVSPGTRVIWRAVGALPHTSTSDTGVWDSGTINRGDSFTWTVPEDTPDGSVFPYHCVFHGAPGGIGMAGTVRVGTGPGPSPPDSTPPPPPPDSTPPPPPDSTPPPPPGADSVVISMEDDFFSPRDITMKPGAKVIWRNVGRSPHTSTSDTGVWDSRSRDPGQSFSWTIPSDTQAGESFPYHCVFHGSPGGQGMAGIIRVDTAAAPPPPPPSPGTVTVTTPGNTFNPERVEILPGETVVWEFSGATHNVVWEDEAPPGGNIPDSPPGTSASRTFPREGDYDYECTRHDGQKGRVRVRAR